MKNKNGFISMSLVYSFLVLFLFLMMSIINCYLKKNTYLEALDKQVGKDISITKDAKQSLFSTILEDNIAIPSNTLSLKKVANTTNKNGNGLYYVEDKTKTDENNDGYGSKIYFFRGAVSNNYVVFGNEIKRNASKQVSEEKSICWRIIRTNEDSSIRLLYSGLQQADGSCPTSGLNIDLSRFGSEYTSYLNADKNIKFNTANADNAYVGYTYGGRISELADPTTVTTGKSDYELYTYTHYHDGSGNDIKSNIKSILDNYFLYHTNLHYSTDLDNEDTHMYQPAGSTDVNEKINIVDDRLANGVYCNDRSIYVDPAAEPTEDNKGYSNITTYYTAYNRVSNGTPTFVCEQSIDRYTLRTISGGTNQNFNALEFAVGLPTVDDVIYAGGALDTANADYYMKSDKTYWTMTPTYHSTTSKIYSVASTGAITSVNATDYAGLRPVISVDASILVMSGNGLRNEPYILK